MAHKLELKFQPTPLEIPCHFQQLHLAFSGIQIANIKNNGDLRLFFWGHRRKKSQAYRIGNTPGFMRTGRDKALCISGIAKNTAGTLQGYRFQPSGQPEKIPEPCPIKFGHGLHVTVYGQHVRESGEDRAKGAVALRTLAMDDIRLDLP